MLTDVVFTGTRAGVSQHQRIMIRQVLTFYRALGLNRLHVGDAIGADQTAQEIGTELGFYVIAHPSDREDQRGYGPAHETRRVLPPLDRNTIMVNEADVGIVVPESIVPRDRSGTWSTARKIDRAHLPYWIIAPDTMWAVDPAGVTRCA